MSLLLKTRRQQREVPGRHTKKKENIHTFRCLSRFNLSLDIFIQKLEWSWRIKSLFYCVSGEFDSVVYDLSSCRTTPQHMMTVRRSRRRFDTTLVRTTFPLTNLSFPADCHLRADWNPHMWLIKSFNHFVFLACFRVSLNVCVSVYMCSCFHLFFSLCIIPLCCCLLLCPLYVCFLSFSF